jgi:uncharacterized membrane-anchored protein YhcB (DUF1043 family)
MSPVWIAFIAGVFVGIFVGVLAVGMCVLSARDDLEEELLMERHINKQLREQSATNKKA